MCKKKDSINKLLPVISISIFVILLSAYLAVSNDGIPASPDNAAPVSYSTPEALQPSEDFRGYGDEGLSAGKFLVATERLRDPRFARAVVLLVHYSYLGSAGIIINRPTSMTLHHVLPDVRELRKSIDDLYFGGPVSLRQITIIIKSSSRPGESDKVLDDIYISRSLGLLKRLIGDRQPGQKFRVYAGYTGWGPGQLESEIARGDWKILKADPGIVFNMPTDDIWQRLIHPGMII
jgi:putative transcriptional regulator